jgi:hypothetical protein
VVSTSEIIRVIIIRKDEIIVLVVDVIYMINT